MASNPITSWQVDGENGQWLTLLFWAPKSQQKVTAAMKLRHLLLGRKVTTKLDSIIKRRDITLSTKVLLISSVQFSSVQSVSDSLQPHESQHARPPRPSPTPRVHSDSGPSSQWCYPAISSSVVPFPPAKGKDGQLIKGSVFGMILKATA